MRTKSQLNPIEIKISTVVAIAVILHESDLAILDAALKKLTDNSADYYSLDCAVIDVADIDCTKMDWSALIRLLKAHGFNPVAVRHAPNSCEEAISQLGLSIDLGSRVTPSADPAGAAAASTTPEPVSPASVTAVSVLPPAMAPMIIDTPVRGGQRIYARGTDLIITAVVNSGAEVIADGSIHIYAPLRGRALAGAGGNIDARIFTMSLEAELVSIAGIYRTFENGHPNLTAQNPIQIKLNGDKIEVDSIQSHN